MHYVSLTTRINDVQNLTQMQISLHEDSEHSCVRRRISAELLATSPEISSPMSRSKRRPDVSSCECQNNYFAELNLFPHRLYIFQVQLISCTSVEGHDFATQGKMHQMQSEQIVFSRLFCTRISRKRKMNLYLAMNFGRFCTHTLYFIEP